MTWRQVRRPRSAAACMGDDSASANCTVKLPVKGSSSGDGACKPAQCCESLPTTIVNQMSGLEKGSLGDGCEEVEKAKPATNGGVERPAKRPCLTESGGNTTETLAHGRSQGTTSRPSTPPPLTEARTLQNSPLS